MEQKLEYWLCLEWGDIVIFSQHVAQTVAVFGSVVCKKTLVLLGEECVAVCDAERTMQSQTD